MRKDINFKYQKIKESWLWRNLKFIGVGVLLLHCKLPQKKEALNNSHLLPHSSCRSQVLYGSMHFSAQGLTLKELVTGVFSERSGDNSNSELIQDVGILWSLEVIGAKSCSPGHWPGAALISCRPLAIPCQGSFQKVVADNVELSIKSPLFNSLGLFLLLPTTENSL